MANQIQCCFRRYEKKYWLTAAQQHVLLDRMQPYMRPDRYGQYTICNIYYDTPDYRLIRASIEKPVYKEKLRVRCYGVPDANGRVFVELKKKFDGVVYKRRVTTEITQVGPLLSGGRSAADFGQIGREIGYFQLFYRTEPKVFIGYDRLAFASAEGDELCITFDTGLRWRESELDLRLSDHGAPILSDDRILMEIKILGTAPLWLSRLLSEIGAFSTSFSKYGACYRDHLLRGASAARTQKEEISSRSTPEATPSCASRPATWGRSMNWNTASRLRGRAFPRTSLTRCAAATGT